ncbi:hypothetical protein M501DRAFT_1019473 [Patellaria atrata CBS 101060]|uniref:Polynucleotide 5'-hydroxyl-kinase GRC3 n=1 Tax=Patellaria atrata CBS 101060 TaxID=1346257 RepID=A0A9P4S4U7_9PEZI|nr:hypothetical protein M501DRAFT_1019473 [Patellaria atrata CBS 101060]
MDGKRKAEDAFGKDPSAPLQMSAFAAAKIRKQQSSVNMDTDHEESESSSVEEEDVIDQNPGAAPEGDLSREHESGYYDTDAQEKAPKLKPTEDVAVKLGEWVPTKTCLHSQEAYDIIRINPHQTLAIIGAYDLTVLEGTIVICGAVIGPGTKHRVYAPSTHALPKITVLSRQHDAKLQIDRIHNTLKDLRVISPLFAHIWARPSHDLPAWRSFSYISNSVLDPLKRSLRPLYFSTQWQLVFEQLWDSSRRRPPAVMFYGEQGSGKSTLAKVFTNALLTRHSETASASVSQNMRTTSFKSVFWLDLDPGQPEYTTPGQVTLLRIEELNLGPSYSHSIVDEYSSRNRIIRAHACSIAAGHDDPQHFILCVIDLVKHYLDESNETPGVPLVINFPGWVVHEGPHIMKDVIHGLRETLTDLVYISNSEKDLGNQLQGIVGPTVKCHYIGAHDYIRDLQKGRRTSAQLREMRYIAYFHHQTSPDMEIPRMTWDPTPLTDMCPIQASFSADLPGFRGIMIVGDTIAPAFAEKAINGTILTIIEMEDEKALSGPELENHQWHDKRHGIIKPLELVRCPEPYSFPYLMRDDTDCRPLHPGYSRMVGLLLVHGFRTDEEYMDIQTPIPTSALRHLNPQDTVLVKIPGSYAGWAYVEDFHKSTHISTQATRRSRTLFEEEREDSRLGFAYKDCMVEPPEASTGLMLPKDWSPPYVSVGEGGVAEIMGPIMHMRRFQKRGGDP